MEIEQLPPVLPDFMAPDLIDADAVRLARGEPRLLAAEAARTFARRAPEAELRPALAAAAEALGEDPADPRGLAHAYRAALPLLAREAAQTAAIADAEAVLAELDDEDRWWGPLSRAPGLAVLFDSATSTLRRRRRRRGRRGRASTCCCSS